MLSLMCSVCDSAALWTGKNSTATSRIGEAGVRKTFAGVKSKNWLEGIVQFQMDVRSRAWKVLGMACCFG